MPDPCELCGTQAESGRPAGGYDGIQQSCPRCGEFRLAGTGMAVIRHVPQDAKVKLSGWVREQNILGDVPELASDRIKLIAAVRLPGLIERADRLLSFLVRKQSKLGERFSMDEPALLAVTYSKDRGELHYIAGFLNNKGLTNLIAEGSQSEIMPAGYIRYEELQTQQIVSSQGFVAMWFDESMQNAYVNGFELGVRDAGYDPVRVDWVEHIRKIDDEIIAQIRRSRFVVADFTGQRGGVYFEAGFALGLNLPVFWTCRHDEIKKLHFDIRQFNCIDWRDADDLSDRLQKRIEAIIGAGPRKPLGA